ncbi:MAG: 30S ribosomal protein S9 [Candidatus Aenigmarchaeota archaeon]|nr:30S ribosomal protein S9 [Candidatus Aenigmarchaeota archaeon]
MTEKRKAVKKHPKKVEEKPKTEKKEEIKQKAEKKVEVKPKVEKKPVAVKTKKEEPKIAKKKKTPPGIVFTTGKRKRAVARASIRPGKGKVLINKELLENISNRTLRLRLMEPFIVSEKNWKSYDFTVNIRGGGILGQTDAARQAIAKGLVEIFGGELRQKFLDYDRSLIAYDPRRTEPHKPPRSSQGPRRYKQRSKR